MLYQQIATSIASSIRSGKYRAGQRLPSARALSASLDVSVNTVVKALAVLAAQGLILAYRGIGYRVIAARPRPASDQGRASAPGPASALSAYIRSRRLRPGMLLPGIRSLVGDLGMSTNTLQKAEALLEASGHLHAIRGVGIRIVKVPHAAGRSAARTRQTPVGRR